MMLLEPVTNSSVPPIKTSLPESLLNVQFRMIVREMVGETGSDGAEHIPVLKACFEGIDQLPA
ncbi:MAG: hypothetical protein ACRC9V_01950, partial [Aeromonas sp.]